MKNASDYRAGYAAGAAACPGAQYNFSRNP